MGWSIYLNIKNYCPHCNGEISEEVATVDSHNEGSIQVLGGNREANMSLTFNYSQFYYEHIDKEDGLRWINGKTGKETLVRLENAITELGTEYSGDYWESTPGNAGKALVPLASWARQHPEGVWEIW